tara:strand:- start:1385 stop:1780 length:396 start_codon:yes stop_codon:yes gene_type:complete
MIPSFQTYLAEADLTDKQWAELKKTTWVIELWPDAEPTLTLGAVKFSTPTSPAAVKSVPAAVKVGQYSTYINLRPDGVNGGINEAGLKRLRIFFRYLKDQKVPFRLNGAEPGKWPNARAKALWAQLMALLK